MKQFLDLLVFTLGKEYRVRHRVLCVVGFLITLSSYHLLLSTLCQTFLTHSCLVSLNDCSSFRYVHPIFSDFCLINEFEMLPVKCTITSCQFIRAHG